MHQMSFYTAVSVYAPAIALSKATGLNTRLAVFLIYLVCVFYSSQGGMKAVVIADTFQVRFSTPFPNWLLFNFCFGLHRQVFLHFLWFSSLLWAMCIPVVLRKYFKKQPKDNV